MAPRPTSTRLAPTAACAPLAACSDSDPGTGSAGLSKAPCADAPALDCGTMDVPLIHDSTDRRRVLVDVMVLPGTEDGPHEPLLLNPGGPGTELVREFAAQDALPAALRERYDVVGFDLGGRTDAQTPIERSEATAEAVGGVYLASDHDGHTSVSDGESRCVDDVALTFLLGDTLPDGASCAANDGEGRGR